MLFPYHLRLTAAVAAFLVGDRRRVVGLRRALGATRWDILRYLLLENLLATQIGNGLGLASTLLLLAGVQRRFAGLHLMAADILAAIVVRCELEDLSC
jgi:putative ABC transport system permease protein